MALTKREKDAAAARRNRERSRAPAQLIMRKGTTIFGAWAGQKWLADVKTPMLETVPAHYTAAGVATLLELRNAMRGRRASGGVQRLYDLVDGAAAGQAGVQGYMNKAPIFGA